MIHEVMIVSQGGLCLYHYEFSAMKVDPQLVAGFTNAIDSFSESLIKKQQNIESLQMSALNLRISPFLHKALSIVLFYNKYDRLDIIDSIIIDLQTQFIERFGHIDLVEFCNMTLLKPFDEVVVPLCKTHLDIGISSIQSTYKAKMWHMLEKIGKPHKGDENLPLTPSENQLKLNAIDYHEEKLKNCDITLWNLDLESVESHHHVFENKQVFLIIVEPDFKFIQRNLAVIENLKKTHTDSHIIGILLTGYGTITKINCEKILQISLSEFQMSDPLAMDNLKAIVHEAIIGIGA